MGLQSLRGCRSSCQHLPRSQCLLGYGRCSRDLSCWCSSAKLSAVLRTEVRILFKIPGSARISWQVFSARSYNTSESLIDTLYTEVFMCPHSQKSRSLRSRIVQASWLDLRVWIRCCVTMQREWDSATSRMKHIWCVSTVLIKKTQSF
jgi:hypothetical protein